MAGNKKMNRKKNKKSSAFGRNAFISVVFFIVVIGCITYFFDIYFNERDSEDPIFGGKDSEQTTLHSSDTTSETTTAVTGSETSKEVTTQETDKPVETTKPVTETKPPVTTTEKEQTSNLFEERSILEEVGDVSNKEYSWWIYLNDENKPSTIDPGIGRIIAPYNSTYIEDPSEKAIYLTFDEGYENGYTASILDTLKKHDVKAVFFITGFYLDKNRDLVERMINEGHVVGNHSVNHPSFPTIDNGEIYDELYNLDKRIYDEFGIRTHLFRPPAGEYSERTLKIADMLGYKTVFWSYAYDDWYTDKIRGAKYAYDKVMSHLHNGGIYLLHAVSKDNTEALDDIITDCKDLGYDFKLLK